ncbi:transposable element Tcb2 transposase [Trichonephila clavipes]|nr:transposable element Tcb2 transposase [Trichonephila clavipes]
MQMTVILNENDKHHLFLMLQIDENDHDLQQPPDLSKFICAIPKFDYVTCKQYEQLSQFERGRIIGVIEAEGSIRRVACQLDCLHCVVRRCWDQWILEVSFTRRPGTGHPRQASREDPPHRKKCTRTANCFIGRNPGTSSTFNRGGASVSSRTIRRRLAVGRLGTRRPLHVLLLVPTRRRLRLEWCCVRGNWIVVVWNHVVFSDESRFSLSSDDNCVRVWRLRGERLNPAFALQRHTAPTAGVMVWNVIAYNTRSPLVLIRGTMTSQWYVLQPYVLPLMQWLSGAIFQQDNTRPHRARGSPDYLRTVTPFPLPADSPDLSSIDHIWDHLGRRLGIP